MSAVVRQAEPRPAYAKLIQSVERRVQGWTTDRDSLAGVDCQYTLRWLRNYPVFRFCSNRLSCRQCPSRRLADLGQNPCTQAPASAQTQSRLRLRKGRVD